MFNSPIYLSIRRSSFAFWWIKWLIKLIVKKTNIIPWWVDKCIKCISLSINLFICLIAYYFFHSSLFRAFVPLDWYHREEEQLIQTYQEPYRASFIVNYWYRAAPISLSWYSPISYFIVYFLMTSSSFAKKFNYFFNRLILI